MKIKLKIMFVGGTWEEVECDQMNANDNNICTCHNETKNGYDLIRVYPLVNVLSIQVK